METILRTPVILPAALYDAMRALAEKHGGVGSGSYFLDDAPCCGVGLAAASHGYHETGPDLVAIEEALISEMGLYYRDSDNAVHKLLNAGHGTNDRVPFALWAKTLPVLRGA